MGRVILTGQSGAGGGAKINGTTVSRRVALPVTSGDFVEKKLTPIELGYTTVNTGDNTNRNFVKVSENLALMFDSGNYGLNHYIMHIDNNQNITYTKGVVLKAEMAYGATIPLGDDKILIASYRNTSTQNYRTYLTMYQVTPTTVTQLGEITMGGTSATRLVNHQLFQLAEGKILLMYTNNANNIGVRELTISGNTITSSSETVFEQGGTPLMTDNTSLALGYTDTNGDMYFVYAGLANSSSVFRFSYIKRSGSTYTLAYANSSVNSVKMEAYAYDNGTVLLHDTSGAENDIFQVWCNTTVTKINTATGVKNIRYSNGFVVFDGETFMYGRPSSDTNTLVKALNKDINGNIIVTDTAIITKGLDTNLGQSLGLSMLNGSIFLTKRQGTTSYNPNTTWVVKSILNYDVSPSTGIIHGVALQNGTTGELIDVVEKAREA